MRIFCTSEGKARTDHKCGIFWGHAGSLYHEKVMKCHAQTTDFFEIICQRVLAGCLFMREAPAIYLFTLRAFFEENPEIKEELRHNDRATFIHGIDDILIPADMDLIRPGIDIQLLLEEINGYLLSCYWKMFSSGELDPDFLENDFMKRIWQWKRVYQREMISPVGEAPSPAPFFEDKNKKGVKLN